MKQLTLFILILYLVSLNAQDTEERQKPFSFEKEIQVKAQLQYLLYLPPGYVNSDSLYPLLLFLHGAGERGDDINLVKKNGPPKLIEEGKDFPFIIVSPQCPQNSRWNVLYLSALLDKIENTYRVDKNRIYVTGLSMGGHGTWELAKFQPDRFAAIAPICGWSDLFELYKLKNLPIWVFHGAKDLLVPVTESEKLVNFLKNIGSEVKFTVYPEAGHDSWTETYNNEELYRWFLQHSLQDRK